MKQEIQEALSNCLTKIVIEFEGKSKKFASCHHKELTLFILPTGYVFDFKRKLTKSQDNVFRNLYAGFVKRLEKVYCELGGEEICGFPFKSLFVFYRKQCVNVTTLPKLAEITINPSTYKEYTKSLPETDLVSFISRRLNKIKRKIIILSKTYPDAAKELVEKLDNDTYKVLLRYDFEGDEINSKTIYSEIQVDEEILTALAKLITKRINDENPSFFESFRDKDNDVVDHEVVVEQMVNVQEMLKKRTQKQLAKRHGVEESVKPKVTGLHCQDLFKKLHLLEIRAPEEARLIVTSILNDCKDFIPITEEAIEFIPKSKKPYTLVLQELIILPTIDELSISKLSKVIEVIDKHTVNLDALVKNVCSKQPIISLDMPETYEDDIFLTEEWFEKVSDEVLEHDLPKEGDNFINDKTDWDKVLNMSEEEIENNAKNDPDNQPMTEEELDQMVPIKRPSLYQMVDIAPESSLNLSHLPEVRGVVLSPSDIKNDEVYFNKQDFFYGQIRIISKYYPEFIFNLVEDFLEALNISKLEKSFDGVKLDEIILNTRIDILSNTLVYIDAAYREKAEGLLTGYINSLDIFLVTLDPLRESKLFEELYSEEMVKLAESVNPNLRHSFPPMEKTESKQSWPFITDLSDIVRIPTGGCNIPSETNMLSSTQGTSDDLNMTIPLGVVENMTITVAPKDTDLIIDYNKPFDISFKYRVTFFHKFYINDDCVLIPIDGSSVYDDIEAASEKEAIANALTEHLTDNSQYIINSVETKKLN